MKHCSKCHPDTTLFKCLVIFAFQILEILTNRSCNLDLFSVLFLSIAWIIKVTSVYFLMGKLSYLEMWPLVKVLFLLLKRLLILSCHLRLSGYFISTSQHSHHSFLDYSLPTKINLNSTFNEVPNSTTPAIPSSDLAPPTAITPLAAQLDAIPSIATNTHSMKTRKKSGIHETNFHCC